MPGVGAPLCDLPPPCPLSHFGKNRGVVFGTEEKGPRCLSWCQEPCGSGAGPGEETEAGETWPLSPRHLCQRPWRHMCTPTPATQMSRRHCRCHCPKGDAAPPGAPPALVNGATICPITAATNSSTLSPAFPAEPVPSPLPSVLGLPQLRPRPALPQTWAAQQALKGLRLQADLRWKNRKRRTLVASGDRPGRGTWELLG